MKGPKKIKTVENKTTDIDMFDRLTHDLIVHIVSYLPFKEAVRTCILSKRWSDVWHEMTNIEFDEKFFLNNEVKPANQILRRKDFIRLVGQFIEGYPRKGIQRFVLTCSKAKDFLPEMNKFVRFAVFHDVRELELDFYDATSTDRKPQPVFELPLETYQLRNIVSLKLFSCGFDPYMLIHFSALKNVSFGWVKIGISSIQLMLVNCPLVESLSLKNCWDLENFKISLQTSRLKFLVIDNCKFRIQSNIAINGPKLEMLKYSGRIGLIDIDPSHLVEADLDFGSEPEFEDLDYLLSYYLHELIGVKVLTLCSVFLQIMPPRDESFGFELPLSARHLILKTAMHFNEYFGIRFMLQSCPNLEILTFDIGPATIFSVGIGECGNYVPPFRFDPLMFWTINTLTIPKCINRSLKVVNVKGYKGSLNELYVLIYIIVFGVELKELNIYISQEEGDDRENRDTYVTRAKELFKNTEPFRISNQKLSLSIL